MEVIACRSALAANLDASGRKPSVRSARALTSRVDDLSSGEDFLVLTEVGPAREVKRSLERADFTSDVTRFGGSDTTVLAWADSWWITDEGLMESSYGKYAAAMLTDGHRKVFLVGVHLPHKGGKRRAYDALHSLLTDATSEYGCDEIVVAGDFNASPSVIEAEFGEFVSPLIYSSTTERGRCIDNSA
jgi:hypothetical protein